MNEIKNMDNPILGLDNSFPENLWLLELGGKHFCHTFEELNGVSCFENIKNALEIKTLLATQFPGIFVSNYTFDEAREIAKSKPNIQCLFLLDNPDNIKIHYIR